MKLIICIMLLFLSTLCNSQKYYGNVPNIYRIDEMIRFEYRAMTIYQILDDEDFETINVYYNLLFNTNKLEQISDLSAKVSLGFLLKILEYALVQNKIPQKYISKLRSYSVALSGFNNGKDFFFNTTTFLWLLEYRSFKTNISANNFLQKSLGEKDSSQNEKILELLKADKKYELIEQWFDGKTIKNFTQLISLLKKEKKILVALKNQNSNAINLLIDDYRATIKQIFSEFNSKILNDVYLELLFKHNDWLFLQIHKYKDLPRIKEILAILEVDWLSFNESSLIDKLPNKHKMGDKYEVFKWINYKLNVFWKIQEIKKLVFYNTPQKLDQNSRKIKI